MSVSHLHDSIYVQVHTKEYGTLFLPKLWAKLLLDVNSIGFVKGLRFEEGLHTTLKKLLFQDPPKLIMIDNLNIVQRITMLIEKLNVIQELLIEDSKTCIEMKHFILTNFYFSNIEGHRWALVTLMKRSIHASIMILRNFINLMVCEEQKMFCHQCEKALKIFHKWKLDESEMQMYILLEEDKISKHDEPIFCNHEDVESTTWLQQYEEFLFSE